MGLIDSTINYAKDLIGGVAEGVVKNTDFGDVLGADESNTLRVKCIGATTLAAKEFMANWFSNADGDINWVRVGGVAILGAAALGGTAFAVNKVASAVTGTNKQLLDQQKNIDALVENSALLQEKAELLQELNELLEQKNRASLEGRGPDAGDDAS